MAGRTASKIERKVAPTAIATGKGEESDDVSPLLGGTAVELGKSASETEAVFSFSSDEGGGVVRSRVAKKNNGTLRTASLPAGRDVVPNVPDLFGSVDARAVWRGRGAPAERVSEPDCSSFARLEEKKWDAEESIPPSGEGRCPQRP